MSKKIIITIIQIIFLVCPVLWLIFAVDYKTVFSVLKLINPAIILFLFVLVFVRFILQSVRFWLLITPITKKIKLSKLILLDWKARYYSIIMPSSAGQDITRAVLLKKYLSISEIAALTIFFRATGVITFILIALFGFFRLYSQEGVSVAAVLVGVLFIIICAAGVILLSEKATQKILSFLPQKTPVKITHFLTNTSKSIQLYKKSPKLFVFNLIFSLFLHFMFLLFPIVAIFAVCGEWRIIEILTFIPTLELIAAAVPFSPNGAGIREGLVLLFFEYINATKEQAFSYITISIILYLMLFFGFFVVLWEKIRKKKL
jgi:uncharacterized protein (TIRG00374 family)